MNISCVGQKASHIPGSESLVEVIDKNGVTLCIMPMEDARAQQLPHRAVAVAVQTDAGQMILRDVRGIHFDVALFSALPALSSRLAFAEKLLGHMLPRSATAVEIGEIQPCPETGQALTSVFMASCPEPLLRGLSPKELLAADCEELCFLRERNMLAPLCVLILDMLVNSREQI